MSDLLHHFDALVDVLGGDVYRKDVLDFRMKLIELVEDAECDRRLIEEKGPW